MRSCGLLIGVLAAAAWCEAQTGVSQPWGPVTVRPARNADLPGTWVMLNLVTDKADREDSTFAPYQIFHFDASGRMKFMTSAKPFSNLALFEAAPLVTRYSLDKHGALTLTNPGWDEPRKYQCIVVVKGPAGEDAKLPHPGDVLLTSVDAGGKPLWSKLLRQAR